MEYSPKYGPVCKKILLEMQYKVMHGICDGF